MEHGPAGKGLTGEELRKHIPAMRGVPLTPGEVSKILRVSKRWVETHMSDGTFPFGWFPIGPRVRLCDSADLNDWLARIRVPDGRDPYCAWSLEQRQLR